MNQSEIYLDKIKKLVEMPKGISPYSYVSDLEEETSQDKVLDGIHAICEMITMNDPQIERYSDEIEYGIEFCSNKIYELESIRQTFELSSVGGSLARIGHSLDLITCQGELTSFNHTSLYMDLAFNIRDLTEKLELFINTLSMHLSKD